MRRAPIALAAAFLGAGCGRMTKRPATGAPPPAEFIVSANDSSFWVRTDAQGVHVRGVPLALAHFDGRFYEVYSADDDHSYTQALLDGEVVYRRDLLNGDSAVVFRDSVVPKIAAAYAATHPGEDPIGPDDDVDDDAQVSATAEVDVLDLIGQYMSYEYRTDVELPSRAPRRSRRRGVLDLRSGRPITRADVSNDFVNAVRDQLPDSASHTDTTDVWRHGAYRVVAHYDSTGTEADLSLVSDDRTWHIGTVTTPVVRIDWLDRPSLDSAWRRALERAFNDAATYDQDKTVAMNSVPSQPAADLSRAIKPVSASRHETSELMMPQDANNMGHIFGGVILSMMDKTAAIAAFRHCRLSVVTASIDRVDFREPIHLGDLVVMKASVNYAGRTSMEVGVRVEAEELLTGRRRHTNSCYLTFVAVDRNGRPMEVPEVQPETPDELRRFEAAKERRRRRLEEREQERKLTEESRRV